MKRFILLGCLLTCGLLQAQVTITANSPTYNWGVLPGSARHINVFINKGTTNLVNWSVASTTGGATATLSSGNFPWVDVTIGATGGTCSFVGTNPNYTGFKSSATVTVRAQSQDDTSKTATFLFNVCTPPVSVIVMPFYRTLYSGQWALLQSYIQGDTNLAVNWSITSQPSGGDGTLSDTNNRDTVFSATVAGRYAVAATSAADGTKKASAIIYVTHNALPYNVTSNKTEPVDCSVDPALTGKTYDVGPTRSFATLASVPWATIGAGSTVRVHNDDTTGTSPTTYHEYFQISTRGGAGQPIRVCGVADAGGNLPIIDGNNATTSSNTSTLGTGSPLSGVLIWNSNSSNKFSTYPTYGEPMYVIVEGLKIQNFKPPYKNYPPGSSTLTTYDPATTSIRSQSAMHQVFLGNELYNNGNGTFSDFNGYNAWGGANMYAVWEGNWIHGNSIVGNESVHQLYIQAAYQIVQFNRIDGISANGGSNLKSRGVGDIIRYNYLGDGAAREIDMVENQDGSQYMTFESYLTGVKPYYAADAYTPNLLASMEEVWHQQFVYGNLFKNTTAGWIQHYCCDNDQPAGMSNRVGTLWFYNNTINTKFGIFDTDGNSGGTSSEYPKIVVQNNIVWTPSPTYGTCWNRINLFSGAFTTNLVSTFYDHLTKPINGATCSPQTTPWGTVGPTLTTYPDALPLDNHMTGLSPANFIATGVQPFDSTTFLPVTAHAANGTALTGAMANMPVRFNYLPALNYAKPRSVPVTSTEGGIIGGVDNLITMTVTPGSSSVSIAQPLLVTITAAGTPIPTGSVKLTSGTYSSVSKTLSNGSAAVTIPAGTLSLGSHVLTATYTPDSNSSSVYGPSTGSASVLVTKTLPTITWGTPAAITYPTPLSSTQLDAAASVPGKFVYTPAAGRVLAAGWTTLTATFTPTDTANYETTITTRGQLVNKATPAIIWATPSPISYPAELTSTQLDAVVKGPAGNVLAGTTTYNPAARTILNPGKTTMWAAFTPTNAIDYEPVSKDVTLVVNKGIPKITWPDPAAITYGTALGPTELDATTNMPGKFVYTPAAGAVLGFGWNTLSVAFNPTDSTHYASNSLDKALYVNKAKPTVAWSNPAPITTGTPLSAAQLNAVVTGADGHVLAGTSKYNPAAGIVMGTGTHTLTVNFVPTDTTNYVGATGTVSITVD